MFFHFFRKFLILKFHLSWTCFFMFRLFTSGGVIYNSFYNSHLFRLSLINIFTESLSDVISFQVIYCMLIPCLARSWIPDILKVFLALLLAVLSGFSPFISRFFQCYFFKTSLLLHILYFFTPFSNCQFWRLFIKIFFINFEKKMT